MKKQNIFIVSILTTIMGSNCFAQNDSAFENNLKTTEKTKRFSIGLSIMPSIIEFKEDYDLLKENNQLIPQINLMFRLSDNNFFLSTTFSYFQLNQFYDWAMRPPEYYFGPDPDAEIYKKNYFNVHLLIAKYFSLAKNDIYKNKFNLSIKTGLGYQMVNETLKYYYPEPWRNDEFVNPTTYKTHNILIPVYLEIVCLLSEKVYFTIGPTFTYTWFFVIPNNGRLVFMDYLQYNDITFISGINIGIVYQLGKKL